MRAFLILVFFIIVKNNSCGNSMWQFMWGEWLGELRHCSKNWKVPGSIPLGARPGLGTQPHYEAHSDPWVENVKRSD